MTYDEFRQWFVDNTIELEGRISAYDLYAGRARPNEATVPNSATAPTGHMPKPSAVAGVTPLPAEERKTPLTSRPRSRRMSSAHAAWKDRLNAAVSHHGAAGAAGAPKTLSKKRSMLGSFANMLGALSEQEARLKEEDGGAPAPTEGATTPAAASEERRAAEDGVAYTKAEFVAHYGGLVEWLSAGPGTADASAFTVAEADALGSAAAPSGGDAGEWQAVAAEGGTYWYHTLTHEYVSPATFRTTPFCASRPSNVHALPPTHYVTPRPRPFTLRPSRHSTRRSCEGPLGTSPWRW